MVSVEKTVTVFIFSHHKGSLLGKSGKHDRNDKLDF